jgi:DNA polymerase III psi subunit
MSTIKLTPEQVRLVTRQKIDPLVVKKGKNSWVFSQDAMINNAIWDIFCRLLGNENSKINSEWRKMVMFSDVVRKIIRPVRVKK